MLNFVKRAKLGLVWIVVAYGVVMFVMCVCMNEVLHVSDIVKIVNSFPVL